MHNRVVYIPAKFATVGKRHVVQVPMGKTKSGWFGKQPIMAEETKFEPTGTSDCNINVGQLADEIAADVQVLNEEGYEVVTVTPLITGDYDYRTRWSFWGCAAADYGYGYSYTKGVVITARRMNA